MIIPQLIINTYVSLMYELKKNGKVFTCIFEGTGPSSYEKKIYRAAVSQKHCPRGALATQTTPSSRFTAVRVAPETAPRF